MSRRTSSLLYIDLGEILTRIEEKYNLVLPRRVVAANYNKYTKNLLIRFRRDESIYEDVTGDGLVVIHYGRRGRLVAIEILDVAEL